jgi:hypothetical protein
MGKEVQGIAITVRAPAKWRFRVLLRSCSRRMACWTLAFASSSASISIAAMTHPTISHSLDPVTVADIEALEHALAACLPDDYHSFLLHYNGGYPQPNVFPLPIIQVIIFWDHEYEADEDEVPSYDNVYVIAGSFQAFLEMLTQVVE